MVESRKASLWEHFVLTQTHKDEEEEDEAEEEEDKKLGGQRVEAHDRETSRWTEMPVRTLPLQR